ncbi:hypothetical protein CARUB_v10016297mg [Capsella rubella]|uniref:Uncharacterized protein n=1 Tax=Capsella rubella TaxID=81985 RepID=R0GB87_9BRAS|nr:hypothetical protein CARUB_v10016297mg [Capsella rubella]
MAISHTCLHLSHCGFLTHFSSGRLAATHFMCLRLVLIKRHSLDLMFLLDPQMDKRSFLDSNCKDTLWSQKPYPTRVNLL